MIGNFLKQLSERRTSSLIVFLVALITIISLIPVSRLRSDFNPIQLLNTSDPDRASYDQFKSRFNAVSEEQSIFIALKNKSGIFQQDFLVKADSLTRFLIRQPGILRVYSLTNTNLIYFNGQDVNARPLLDVSQPEFYKDDSVFLFESKEYRDFLVSANGDAIAIGAFNDTSLTKQQKKQLIRTIQSKINELNFDESHLISRIQFENASVQKAKLILAVCFLGFLIVILIGGLLLRRSFRYSLVTLVVIITLLLWSLAFVSLLGSSLNFFTVLLQMVLILFVSTILIFIGNTYPESLMGKKRRMAGRMISSAIIVLLTTIVVYFINQKQTDPHLSDSVPDSFASQLKFVDQNFYGSRPFEMVLTMNNKQHSFYDIDMMQRIQEIEQFLRDSLQVGAIISPIALFKGANKAFHGGVNNYFKIPDSIGHVQRFAEAIMQTEYADEMQRYMVGDGSIIRISGRVRDVGLQQFHFLSGKLERFSTRKYAAIFSYQLAGSAMIYDKIYPHIVKTFTTIYLLIIAIYLLTVINFGQIASNENHTKN